VPNGIVATTQNAYVKLRKFLVEDSLVAVVSLPAGVFKPYSGVKTSILFLDKRLARQSKEILFLKITADGFDLGDKRNPIEANDLPEAERLVKLWLTEKLKEGTQSGVAWKAVAKSELLEGKHVVLATERFLGEMGAVSEEHPTTRLGDVADYVRGLTYGKGDEAELPTANAVLRAQNVSLEESRLVLDDLRYLRPDFEGSAEKRLRADDILVCSSSGSKSHLGKVAFVPTGLPYFFGGFMGVLRSRRELIEPRFLFRLLTSQHHKTFLAGLTEGANINNLKLTEYLEYEIPLPPLEEQRRIVAEIEDYQKVLDGARQILSGWQLRVDAQRDWPVASLSEAAELTGGYAFKSTEMKPAPANGSDLPVVKIGNVGRDGRLDMTDAEFHAFTPDLARFVLRTGDIAVAMTGATVGKVAEVDRDNLLLNQRVGVVRSKETAEQKYLLHVLRSPDFYTYCQATAGGGAQGNIAPRQILEYEIPLPPLDEQLRIVAELDAEAAQMEAVRALLPRFEAKIQHVLDRVWGNGIE
jgi:type I restriction enzyme M protein